MAKIQNQNVLNLERLNYKLAASLLAVCEQVGNCEAIKRICLGFRV